MVEADARLLDNRLLAVEQHLLAYFVLKFCFHFFSTNKTSPPMARAFSNILTHLFGGLS